jgi:glycosyltransferase involved in cell wall biosynthesis
VALRKQLCLLPSAYHLPILWDSVDCISNLFEQAARNSRSEFGRLVTRFELPRTKKYEAWLVAQFDRVLVTSSVDAAALESLCNDFPNGPHPSSLHLHPSEITVLPNGVDLDNFVPGNVRREPETIIFTGKMSYHANVTAALRLVNDIMPLVWKERTGACVQIVGKDPSRQVRALAKDPRLLVTGSVPDLRPFLQRGTVAVAPMSYGAGIQNKVLEAMACAIPVVATSQAVSALHVRPEEHFLLANEPADLARQILRLLDDADLRLRVGQAGRRYVEEHHDWDRIVEQLEGIYRELVELLPLRKQPEHLELSSHYLETEHCST